MADIFHGYIETEFCKIFHVCAWHRGIEERPTPLFLGYENQAAQLSFALLIPDDDFNDVLVKLCWCILSRNLEFVSAAILLIDNINLLVEFWSHHRFNLKFIRVESYKKEAHKAPVSSSTTTLGDLINWKSER
jgi:hypothetical protein